MNDYYLIGKKLSHSYSAAIHKKRGFNYSLKEIAEEDLCDFFARRNFAGLNVTVPYKEKILPFLDELDVSARKIGAVNTVLNDGGKLIGYNTDFFGLDYTLKRSDINVDGKSVLILGSGGAAKTAKALCLELGAKDIAFVGRSGALNYSNYTERSDTQILFNCTPVGTYPFDYARPVDLSLLPNLEAVIDLVYNPLRSMLIQQAEKLGLKAVNGLFMLVAQAYAAEKIWSGKSFTVDEINTETETVKDSTENIALVGMAGVGKTSVARVLGAIIGREVIDTDETVKRNYGLAPYEIIERYGESYFRQIEELAVDDASQRRGVIISLGGGAVLSEKNRLLLRSNSRVIFIKRDFNLIDKTNRPLYENHDVEQLYNERKTLYKEVSDFTVYNDGTIEECAEAILKL